jgi:hypothetical protein
LKNTDFFPLTTETAEFKVGVPIVVKVLEPDKVPVLVAVPSNKNCMVIPLLV